MGHIAVLALSASFGGSLTEYATPEQAQTAVERFGHALSVEVVDDGDAGCHWRVSCPEQRGDRGAFRLHSIACDLGIPVHVDQEA